MKERKSVTRAIASRYQKASKREKGIILDEFTQLTGYTRCYASYLLGRHGKRVRIKGNVVVVGDVRVRARRRDRHKIYDSNVLDGLKKVWLIMGCICGKRLAPVLEEVIGVLERHKEIELESDVREKLLSISPATIDRLLREEKKRWALRSRSGTKPGTLLKHQIPIRTFSEWDEQRPGFVEMDLVGHEGGDSSGDYIQTLDMTDVCTGWTETQAVRNKARMWVFEALKQIRDRLPFPLLGIDSDNGSEFINSHLYHYCQTEEITFTRARAYRKNDNCYVEQKNYSVVRRAVGYMRYDTGQQLRVLNELYGYLRLYTNYFQPVMKLTHKTRVGSRVRKKYDLPKTPYQRVLESSHVHVEEENKEALRREYAKLNPAELKRHITALQIKLRKLAIKQREIEKKRAQSIQHDQNNKKTTKNFV
jgi:hypothetical protein